MDGVCPEWSIEGCFDEPQSLVAGQGQMGS